MKENMKTLNKNSLIVSLLMSLVLTTACAQSDQSATIKKLIGPKLGAEVKVDSVTKTPYSGLYEVKVGGDIFYTDEKANYLILGNVIDLKSKTNLTKIRVEEVNKVKLSEMPLDLAIKQVKGDGKRELVIFEDPNCGYCKKLRHELQKLNNVTIYTFMYDILSADSAVKSKNVWCSKDPVTAWNDMMVDGKAPPDAPATCMTNPHDKILELGKQLHITGTPTIFFKDGSRIPGYVDLAKIEEKLASIK
jgi:thiol:disulfide interchange protein DsbC